jgi:Thiolase, C-terminal domain
MQGVQPPLATSIGLNYCSALWSVEMRGSVIVFTGRTGLAKSLRGSPNTTHPITCAGHAHAMRWAGVDPDKYNVDGGAIAVGHPYGVTGSRAARLIEIFH